MERSTLYRDHPVELEINQSAVLKEVAMVAEVYHNVDSIVQNRMFPYVVIMTIDGLQ